ncbi:hypothetical protein ACIQC5_11550 [Paenarthrobacter sp. NPDC092416]|uniref:hypothetical protein n=1 Tax=Paenarthrobacter sp. NPDC092416 TaxID=3364386 RepID=UPI003828A3E5
MMIDSQDGRPMKVDELSKQYAVHFGVSGSVLLQINADARARGMRVFEIDLSGLSDVPALCAYLEAEFMYLYRTDRKWGVAVDH